MNWGNVMEQVITNLTEIIFDCEIIEMGSIPTAGAQHQRCSPDGVAIVKSLGNAIVSFEFKAPARRMPKSYIPKYYKSQVKAQLCAITPSDFGIFVDTVLRRCEKKEWTFESVEYDKTYHPSYSFDKVFAKTILCFYNADGSVPSSPPVDYGAVNADDFKKLLSDIAENKIIVAEYGRIIMPNKDSDITADEELSTFMKKNAIGFVCTKVMKIVIIPVSKEPDYINKLQPKITEIIDVIKQVNAEDDYEKKCLICNKLCDEKKWEYAKRYN